MKIIRSNILEKEDVFLAEIDGSVINTEEDYVRAMTNAFAIPHKLPSMTIEWLNDDITTLQWVKCKEVVLLIHNYDLMLIHNLRKRKKIMLDFKEIILPWWEYDVVEHMVGGEQKKFVIYLESLRASLLSCKKKSAIYDIAKKTE